MLRDDQDLRYILTTIRGMEAQCTFIKKYWEDFPAQRLRLAKILSEIKGFNEFEAMTYITNLLVGQ